LEDLPDDPLLDIQLGYLQKTLGQAFDVAGQRDRAEEHYDLAAKVFLRVKEDVPASAKTAADLANAINGLGNLYAERGDLDRAIACYRQAVDLNPAHAYAWHDLFGAYHGLARRGRIELEEMRHALQKVKETGAGLPGLGADYIRQLEGYLAYWE